MERAYKKIENTISCVLGVCNKLKYKLSDMSLTLIYDALIHSRLAYCSIVWASTYRSNLQKIYSLQRRFLKMCHTKTNEREQIISLNPFQYFRRLDIYKIIIFQISKFVYQSLNGLLPSCFKDYFNNISQVHHYNTRSLQKLYHVQSRTNKRKFHICVKGPIVWNEIPQDIRNKKCLPCFANALENYYLVIDNWKNKSILI